MGMYTEISFSAELKQETPAEVIEALQKLTQGEAADLDHPFFNCDRADCLMTMGSAYFPQTISAKFTNDYGYSYRLTFRANLKNYCSEIEKFLDWVWPWLAGGSGMRELVAVVMYEEADEPDLYYLEDKEGRRYEKPCLN